MLVAAGIFFISGDDSAYKRLDPGGNFQSAFKANAGGVIDVLGPNPLVLPR
ncbi:hypothetical protein [Sphingobium sp. WCS2017Hpa-17]|uniref:hypothetical protein n=1 Tax=Sphingobium sp. WCS2017Hpa-17 TaxID=3073638 RepID=UPI00386C8F3D